LTGDTRRPHAGRPEQSTNALNGVGAAGLRDDDEAAHHALRFCPQAKRFHERKKAKTNAAVAAKALAHKLARACYHILKESKPFDMNCCFA
jgi:transposase